MNLYEKLPPYRGERKEIVDDHSTGDIVEEVCKAHYVYAGDYDKIAADFERSNVQSICAALFSWCKRSLKYKEENENLQTTRSPAAIIKMGTSWGVDCKHYAGFIGGVLDALRRKGYKINWCYRFVSYDLFDKTPGHVFIVVRDGDREIFVDPVLSSLDQRFPVYYYKQDKFCNMLQRISGVRTGWAAFLSDDAVKNLTLVDASGNPVDVGSGDGSGNVPGETKSNTILWIAVALAAGYFLYKNSKRKR